MCRNAHCFSLIYLEIINMIFFKKLNKKLDKIISFFDDTNAFKEQNEQLKEQNKQHKYDSDMYYKWYREKTTKNDELEKVIQGHSNITSGLQSTISILENKLEYCTSNQESVNLLKKELQNKLDKVEKQEQELKNKQTILDIRTQEMEKKQCQYIELFSSLNIQYNVKKVNNKKTIKESKSDTVEAGVKADSVKESL